MALRKNPDLDAQVGRILAVLNSRGVGFEGGLEQLSDADAAAKFLAPAFGAEIRLPSKVLSDLKRLRQALLELISSGWKSNAAANTLNDIATRSTYKIVFRSDQEALFEPFGSTTIVGLVLKDVAALIEAGQWNRVKHCSNEACSSTFFDRSKNKTQRWHSFELCGNRHNVAAHRARLQ
ncbi:CGNR zinc finger domain-containing protein [Granulicella arctica]|uniref:CGNR zinc finger domain-containing protein n=1 Tax=Granulicella arctica TaxID=940613 RepID=UPI0021E0C988|nr:CGNR zinc finger domain-containing protein [Granulicella arctica]